MTRFVLKNGEVEAIQFRPRVCPEQATPGQEFLPGVIYQQVHNSALSIHVIDLNGFTHFIHEGEWIITEDVSAHSWTGIEDGSGLPVLKRRMVTRSRIIPNEVFTALYKRVGEDAVVGKTDWVTLEAVADPGSERLAAAVERLTEEIAGLRVEMTKRAATRIFGGLQMSPGDPAPADPNSTGNPPPRPTYEDTVASALFQALLHYL